MTGYQVDIEALNLAVKGINDSISTLGGMVLGGTHTAASGSAVEDLNLDEDECGDEVLSDAMDEFCERWRWGVRHLVQEGQAMAKSLQQAAGTYKEVEDQVGDACKRLFETAFGNPMGADDAAGKSWGQLGDDAFGMSEPGEQRERAEQGIGQAMSSIGKDLRGEQTNMSLGGRL